MKAAHPLIHIIDDDESFRIALACQLRAAKYRVQAYSSAAEFLHSPTIHEPGCAIVDLGMPEINGLELQEKIAAMRDPLPVVFLTARGDVPSSVRAMRAGAEDFLGKTAPGKDLLGAVARALARDQDERSARAAIQARRALLATLSEREREVLALVVRGLLNKQIAAELFLHERTVKFHRSNITTKLRMPSVAELALFVQSIGGPDALLGSRSS